MEDALFRQSQLSLTWCRALPDEAGYEPWREKSGLTSMDNDDFEVLPAASEMLAALWVAGHEQRRDASGDPAIRAGCVAVAIARHGVDKVGVFPGWDA